MKPLAIPSEGLRDRHILLVEDEYFIVNELVRQLTAAGAKIVGPVPNIDDACRLINATEHIDAAVLDLNLQGELAFGVADLLAAKGTPFVFATGYDHSSIPSRYADIVRCQKPIDPEKLIDALLQQIAR